MVIRVGSTVVASPAALACLDLMPRVFSDAVILRVFAIKLGPLDCPNYAYPLIGSFPCCGIWNLVPFAAFDVRSPGDSG